MAALIPHLLLLLVWLKLPGRGAQLLRRGYQRWRCLPQMPEASMQLARCLRLGQWCLHEIAHF